MRFAVPSQVLVGSWEELGNDFFSSFRVQVVHLIDYCKDSRSFDGSTATVSMDSAIRHDALQVFTQQVGLAF